MFSRLDSLSLASERPLSVAGLLVSVDKEHNLYLVMPDWSHCHHRAEGKRFLQRDIFPFVQSMYTNTMYGCLQVLCCSLSLLAYCL